MKGYLMYKVGYITFEKEYIKDFKTLSEADIYIRLINFKTVIIKSEKENVNIVFKGQVVAGNKDLIIS